MTKAPPTAASTNLSGHNANCGQTPDSDKERASNDDPAYNRSRKNAGRNDNDKSDARSGESYGDPFYKDAKLRPNGSYENNSPADKH